MFIATDWNGNFINSDDIARIGRSKNKHGVSTAHAVLRDGRTVDLIGGDAEELATRLTPVIPAAPGFEALLVIKDDERDAIYVERHPVLGWRHDYLGYLQPVLLEENECSNASIDGVKYPDGRVVRVAEAVYEDEAKWLAAMQDEFKRRPGKSVA